MWRDVGTPAQLDKLRKVVLSDDEGRAIVVVAHEGEYYAMQNECIHRQRELSKGVVLNGRLVCPGHQWSFELCSGWEAVKEQCQPTYPVRVQDGVVQVDVAGRRVERDATGLVHD